MQWLRRHILQPVLAAAILAGLLCCWRICASSNQTVPSKPQPLTFIGEYSTDGVHWAALTESAVPDYSGDTIWLRGRFDCEIPQGQMLYYYREHIGVSIYVDGMLVAMDEVSRTCETGQPLTDAMCARQWDAAAMPAIGSDDLVEIRLVNRHRFGGETACRYFLNTMCLSGERPELLQENLAPAGGYLRGLGSAMAITAVLLFGAAIVACALRIPTGCSLAVRGALVLFMGGIVCFDAIDSSFSSSLLLLSSYGWQLCVMLCGLCFGYSLVEQLAGRWRRLGAAVLLGAGAGCTLLFLLSLRQDLVLYDLLPVWAVIQGVLCIVLTLCSAGQTLSAGQKDWLYPVSAAAAAVAFVLDLLGVGSSILSRGTCSKVVFLVLIVVHLSCALIRIVRNYQASVYVKKLEKELEASRVAVMLSQIRPHFLFNSLGAIQELCHNEPAAAEAAIEKFAVYLRGNMSALSVEKLIPFEEEMKHVRSYLDLEQLRFGDQLEVKLDITTTGFRLPVLTVQPLVENAVRHGVRKNENGGWVKLSTREYPDRWEIAVEDNGPGFLPHNDTSERLHVGLQNVRLRLEQMCRGTIRIESGLEGGACVRIIIPKEDERC